MVKFRFKPIEVYGKTDTGKYRIIKVDDDGNVYVLVSGSLTVDSITNPVDVLPPFGDTANVGQTVTVGTSSAVTLLSANPDRKYAIIRNKDNRIWLGFGRTPAVNDGDLFLEAGEAYEFTFINLYKGEVKAIAEGSDSTVTVFEL